METAAVRPSKRKQQVLAEVVTMNCAVCRGVLVATVEEVMYGLPFYTCRKCFGFDVYGKKGESYP